MIVLSGDPVSTNSLYKRHGHIIYMTTAGRQLKESYQWQAKIQWNRPILQGEIEITIRLYFRDKRRRDWDNFHKLTMDALNGIVYKDDSQIKKATVEKFIDSISPRIEISIIEILLKK